MPPAPLQESLEGILERVIFENPDPRVQRLKTIWDEAKREAKALLESACEEKYRTRLNYHKTCQEVQPELLAKADASVLRQLCLEEYDERLSTIWADVTRRVSEILEELKAEQEE